MPDLVQRATRELYAVSPEEFMQRRADLAAQARKKGDAEAAQAITKLRKPTVGAWIVNARVLGDRSVVKKLTDLGGRMRAAQDALDAAKLRELTGRRRELIDKLTADAFRQAGRTEPPAALRDEVSGTFEAAIADEDIARRLGTLQRAEQWSGFGFLPAGSPELTLVRGGREQPQAKSSGAAETAPKVSAAEKRKRDRALATAQRDFDIAERDFDAAQTAQRDLDREVKRLGTQLQKVQARLDDARAELEQARKDVTTARGQRRAARSALDHAERDAAR